MSDTVRLAHYREQFYREVDGYIVWEPVHGKGYLNSHNLRELADELDRLNKEWEEQVRIEFAKLALMQQPLGDEYAKVLYDNLNDLYEDEK